MVGFAGWGVLLAFGLIAASASAASNAGPVSLSAENTAATKAHVAQNYGRIPLSFEANHGQADKPVKFVSKGGGYALFLTNSSAVLALSKPDAPNAKPGRLQFAGARKLDLTADGDLTVSARKFRSSLRRIP